MRDAASAPSVILDALVERGRLPLRTALAFAETVASPAGRIEGVVRLLPRVTGSERDRLVQQVLRQARGRVSNRSAIGVEQSQPEAPLTDRQHLDVVTRLAALSDLDSGMLGQLIGLAREAPNAYSLARALAIVATRAEAEEQSALLTEAWSVACGLRRFDGRPEAQAFVAVRTLGPAARERVAEALAETLDVLEDSVERLRYELWGPFSDSPRIGHPHLLRLEEFAEPLRWLAPLLDADQVHTVLHSAVGSGQLSGAFAVTAVLARVAQFHSPEAAWQLALGVGTLVVLALAELGTGGAGLPPDLTADDLLEVVSSLDDVQLRLLSLVALCPLLDGPRRREVVARVLEESAGDAAESPGSHGFRREMIKRLSPVVRSLEPALRDPLISELVDGGPLQVTDDESRELLDSLTDLLPTDVLEERLAATRSLRLDQEVIDRMRRRPTAHPPHRPAHRPLDAALARKALHIAAAQRPLSCARMLIFLAPLLHIDDRDEALRIARTINLVQLRAEPLWRLTEHHSARTPELVAECLETALDIPGGLERVQALIDDMALDLSAAPDVRADAAVAQVIDGFLHAAESAREVAAALPVVVAVGGDAVRVRIEETMEDLATWFGATDVPTVPRATPKPRGDKVPTLVLEGPVGGAELVEACVARGAWDGVRTFLDCLRSAGEEGTYGLRLAEGHVVRSLAEASSSPTPDSVADDQLALVRAVAQEGPTAGRRLAARAALLRHAVAIRDCVAAADILVLLQDARTAADTRHGPDSVSGAPVPEPVPSDADPLSDEVMFQLAADLVHAELLWSNVHGAAHRMRGLLAEPGPYVPQKGRILTGAATALQRALGEGESADRSVTTTLDGYFHYVSRHTEDYALQEAAGRLLRDQVVMAVSTGRPVDAAILQRLDDLADADDPEETVLHTLDVEAKCAAAAVAAPADAPALLRAAFDRWRRHPEVASCGLLFVDTALAVGEAASRRAMRAAAAEAACLALLVASRIHSPERTAGARERLAACAADLPTVIRRFRAEPWFTSADEILLGAAGARSRRG
ncbi:hypothetical protein [Streptomyces mirabilis]|uniref:hypothetical protein n=1 Tax=Streptomyces mirabilis TaxID=68239 RepID=UPI0033ACC186